MVNVRTRDDASKSVQCWRRVCLEERTHGSLVETVQLAEFLEKQLLEDIEDKLH